MLTAQDIVDALLTPHEIVNPFEQHKRLAKYFAWDVVLQPLLGLFELTAGKGFRTSYSLGFRPEDLVDALQDCVKTVPIESRAAKSRRAVKKGTR